MRLEDEKSFEKWCKHYLETHLIIGDDEKKEALYEAYSQGFDRARYTRNSFDER